MWFFNFKKKEKGEEPEKTQATDSKVSSANPNEVLKDIAGSIYYAMCVLRYAEPSFLSCEYILKELDDARNKCNLQQIRELYHAIDDVIRLLDDERWFVRDDIIAYNLLSAPIRELRDAQLKCYRIW